MAAVLTTLGDPVLLGLVSDTHGEIVDWRGVQPKVARLFEAVDAILHCGDVGTPDVLEALATIAPVLALRGTEAPPADGEQLVDGERVVDCAGCRIGVTFSLGHDPVGATLDDGLAFPSVPASGIGDVLFGGPVDAVVFGGSHQALTAVAAGVLFVNPGSPTLADQTTVGLLRVAHGVASVKILPVQ